MKNPIASFVFFFMMLPFFLFAGEKEPFRVKERTLEIGIAQVRTGVSNNFLTASQIFNRTLTINTDEFINDFRINFGLGLIPVYFTYQKDNLWGVGLSLGADAAGIIHLSKNMLSLSEAVKETSYASGAVFTEMKFTGFFTVHNIKIKINPSLFYPLVYVNDKSNVFYTFRDTPDGPIADLNYHLKVYTAFPVENNVPLRFTALPGLDFHLGAEYPLAEALGLKQRFKFLDFIIGLDLINIPLVPAQMRNYMEIAGRIGGDEPISFLDVDDSFFNAEEPYYGIRKRNILRPFKMLAWSDWKPFKFVPVSFIPTLGFAINPFYDTPASLEAGIKVNFNLANLFIAALGAGYHDRLWINSLDLAFNFRYFELDLGMDIRSQDFVKSWQGAGFGIYIGLKFGC